MFNMLRVLCLIFSVNLLYANTCFNNINSNMQFLLANNDSVVQFKAINTNEESKKNDAYLQGDINILSQNAPLIVNQISNIIYKNTGVNVYINIVKDTLHSYKDISKEINTDGNNESNFQYRRLYESKWLANISGKYAVIFLFYNDHHITLKSNLEFLSQKDIQNLLEEYAYPYLPAESVGNEKYDDGINEGISNIYLALTHTIAKHFNFELKAPKPMEKPSDMTKVVIYVMLIILIGLFILVRFGLLAFKNKKGD